MSDTDPTTGEILNEGKARTVPPEIIKAKIAVMKKAHGIGKTGRNDYHKYDFASDFDVLRIVQPAMVEEGLALEMWPETTTGPDADGSMHVCFMMQWQHESGACADPIPWYGIAQDRDSKGRMGDKWFNKAATAAEKYFLLKQLHIPTSKDLDPDGDRSEPAPITADEKEELVVLQEEVGANTAKFLGFFRVEFIDQLPRNRFEEAKRMLEAKRPKPTNLTAGADA